MNQEQLFGVEGKETIDTVYGSVTIKGLKLNYIDMERFNRYMKRLKYFQSIHKEFDINNKFIRYYDNGNVIFQLFKEDNKYILYNVELYDFCRYVPYHYNPVIKDGIGYIRIVNNTFVERALFSSQALGRINSFRNEKGEIPHFHINENGLLKTFILKNGINHPYYLARIVYGNECNGKDVCFKTEDKFDCRFENLYLK